MSLQPDRFAGTTLLIRHDVVALLGILLGILAIVTAAGMLRGNYHGAVIAGGLIAFDLSHDASKLIYWSATGLPDWASNLPAISVAAIYLVWFGVFFLLLRSLFSRKALAWFDRADRSSWNEMGKAFIAGAALFCVSLVVISIS